MIRAGRDDDSASVIALIRDAWSDYEDCVLDVHGEAPELRAPASHVAGQGGAMLVAGEMDGVIMAAPAEAGWHIERLYVARARRGAGIGSALLARIEALARPGPLTLNSDSRFHPAHAFYERHSFIRRHPAHVLDDLASSIDLRYGKPLAPLAIEALDAAGAHSAVDRLGRLLAACVDEGASVSFRAPLSREAAGAFWRGVADEAAAGRTVLLAAWADGQIVGTAQLNLATSQNQPHRADVRKVLVHPAHQRRGIARALMARVEVEAWAVGRELLVLDTLSGSAGERLYRAMGWLEAGTIPGYSRDAAERPEATTYFYKDVVAGART